MSQSLVNAIYERYGEIGETYKSCSISCSINCSEFSGSSSSSSCSPVASPLGEGEISDNSNSNSISMNSPSSNNFASEISFFIPPVCSPRKTQAGLIMTPVKSVIMTDRYLNQVGDHEELSNCCQNVLELDLSKNEFMDWNEIKKILKALKNLRLLNLSHNPLTNSLNYKRSDEEELSDESSEILNSAWDYFQLEWNLEQNEFQQLEILILNSCHLDLRIVELLLARMPSLSELHLASNNYSRVTFSNEFRKESLKILYLNNNNFSEWREVLKFGICFPMLENLVLSDNPLSNFSSSSSLNSQNSFKNLEILILNKLNLTEWSAIDQLRDFPNLKHVRIQNIPLLNNFSEEEKYYLIVGHLDDCILSVNGSKITSLDKENCERKYIRHYLDFSQKPDRYYELENRHGKLNKLADINMEGNKKVTCKIKYRDRQMLYKVDVRHTVGDFKKQLEKFVGHPSSRFKLFYIDIEACSMAVYGPEELKHMNRCLYSFNIVDGDEFEIDLKPPPIIHVASEHQFQNTTSQYRVNSNDSNITVTKPLPIRHRKISDNSSSSESSQSFTRVTRKNKPFYSGHLSKSAGKKNESVDVFSSLQSNSNKMNKTNLLTGNSSDSSGASEDNSQANIVEEIRT